MTKQPTFTGTWHSHIKYDPRGRLDKAQVAEMDIAIKGIANIDTKPIDFSRKTLPRSGATRSQKAG